MAWAARAAQVSVAPEEPISNMAPELGRDLRTIQQDEVKAPHGSRCWSLNHGCSLISPTLGSPVLKPNLESEGRKYWFRVLNS